MMDVSDGLLIDAARMAHGERARGRRSISPPFRFRAAYRAFAGDDRAARLAAATAGDDYQLLFAAARRLAPAGPGDPHRHASRRRRA